MSGRTSARRAGPQQGHEPLAPLEQELGSELLHGPLGNAFAQQLLRGELDAATAAQARALGPELLSPLLDLAQIPQDREAIEILADLSPSRAQLELAESLEDSPLSPEDLGQITDIADTGADVGELEALSELHQAGAPIRQIGAQLQGAGQPTRSALPYQAELEAAFGADLSDVDVELGAAAALAPLGADALAEDGVLRFADNKPDKADVAHEVAHHLQGKENGQGTRALSSPNQAGEREAEAAAKAALKGEPTQLDEAMPAERSAKSWLGHTGDFFSGMWEGAKDTVGGLWSMAVGTMNLTQPLIWVFAPERTAQTWSTLTTTVKTIFTNPGAVWDAFKEPFVKDWTEGRPASAIGRGVFELLSLLVGTKGVDKVAKGSKLLNVVDDAARIGNKTDELATIAGKTDELAKVSDDVAGLSDDVVKGADDAVKSGDDVAKAADDAAKSSDDIAKNSDDATKSVDDTAKAADDTATTQGTKDHVHRGETETAPNSEYFGKWNTKGLHDWDGLVARCAQDGYEIIKVLEDPATGTRRVYIRRHGVHPKTGEPVVGGVFRKTTYPKKLTPQQMDEMGESAYQAARQGKPGTKLTEPGARSKKDGSPADGKFEADVEMPDGSKLSIEGWFHLGPDGKPVISSHTPAFSNSWPELTTADW